MAYLFVAIRFTNFGDVQWLRKPPIHMQETLYLFYLYPHTLKCCIPTFELYVYISFKSPIPNYKLNHLAQVMQSLQQAIDYPSSEEAQ